MLYSKSNDSGTKSKIFYCTCHNTSCHPGTQALQSQDSYHKALVIIHPEALEIINGYHSLEKGYLPVYKKPIDKNSRVEVWRLEEKQTDVNIALHMYRDVIKQECEQVVLVSSDSDLEPSVKFISKDFNDFRMGLILARKQPKAGTKYRSENSSLSQYTDWTHSYVLDEELLKHQFPDKVSGPKKPAIKPNYW